MEIRPCVASILSDKKEELNEILKIEKSATTSYVSLNALLSNYTAGDEAIVAWVGPDVSKLFKAQKFDINSDIFDEIDESSTQILNSIHHEEILKILEDSGTIKIAMSEINIIRRSLRNLSRSSAQRGESLEELLTVAKKKRAPKRAGIIADNA